MTSPPTPPNRRRRRWLIVALVLVLVGGVAWWNWPRGDARFVGRWIVTDPTAPASGSGGMSFFSSGVAHWTVTGSPGSLSFTWRVDGNDFVMGEESSATASSIADHFSSALEWLTSHGVAYGGGEERYGFSIVSPDEILLESRGDGPSKMRLQRAP